MNARLVGAPFAVAMAIQAVGAVAAVGLIWVVFRKRPAAEDLSANAIFLAAAVFGTPYLLSYDTLSLGAVAALLLVRTGQPRILPLLAYLLPLLQLIGLPGPALIPGLFAFQQARRRSAPA
jgi:hypothetical protein